MVLMTFLPISGMIQVHALPLGLGSSSGQRTLTYYPRMPGNSTTRPEEKAALQRSSMSPGYFVGAVELSCSFVTLDELMAQTGIEHIHLLKVPHAADPVSCSQFRLCCLLGTMLFWPRVATELLRKLLLL